VKAVLLVSHGGVPKDLPRTLLKQLKAAEAASRQGGPDAAVAAEQARELDGRIRAWPRTDETDPYRAGVEALAAALRPKLQGRTLALAYNEFCAPSIADAIDQLAKQGAVEVAVVTTMMTPGGSHSEVDIPHALDEARSRHPKLRIAFAWPFDMAALAQLLSDHVAGWPALADTAADGESGA
jgi:sirohydrochlorin cobaltochelatase